VRIDRRRFEALVEEALAALPEAFRRRMQNVAVTVADHPTREQVRAQGGDRGSLLGLYEGEPLTERREFFDPPLPARITLFQENLEANGATEAEIREEIRRTVLHEVGHHFGIDDDRLDDLGY
jgi:predicted Zn-dependent protease with MMP-like domain